MAVTAASGAGTTARNEGRRQGGGIVPRVPEIFFFTHPLFYCQESGQCIPWGRLQVPFSTGYYPGNIPDEIIFIEISG